MRDSRRSWIGIGVGCYEVYFSELYAFQTQQALCDLVDSADRASQDYNFQAVVAIEMNVERRYCLEDVGVLEVDELFGNHRCVVVVNEADRSDGVGLGVIEALATEALAHQVAYGLGAAFVPLLGNETVEFREETLLKRNADTLDFVHLSLPFRITFQIAPNILNTGPVSESFSAEAIFYPLLVT